MSIATMNTVCRRLRGLAGVVAAGMTVGEGEAAAQGETVVAETVGEAVDAIAIAIIAMMIVDTAAIRVGVAAVAVWRCAETSRMVAALAEILAASRTAAAATAVAAGVAMTEVTATIELGACREVQVGMARPQIIPSGTCS